MGLRIEHLRQMEDADRRRIAKARPAPATIKLMLGVVGCAPSVELHMRADFYQLPPIAQTRSHNVQSRDSLADEVDRQNAYERLPDDLSAYLVRMIDGDYRVTTERDALINAIGSELRAEYDRKTEELEDAKATCALADEFGDEEGIKAASVALHECMRQKWPSWRAVYERMPRMVLADLGTALTDAARGEMLGRSRQQYIATWSRPYRWILGRWYDVLHVGRNLVRDARSGT